MHDDASSDAAPTMDLGRTTLIYDRARARPLAWLAGVLVLPVGAEVALPGGSPVGVVVGVRLEPGEGTTARVRLDVELPGDGGATAVAAAVPEPIAAATADLDLDPDAAKPLGAPLH